MPIPSLQAPSFPNSSEQLPRTLGPLMLWGLGVGYVISGMYFGWNLGLAQGGTGGLAVATLLIIFLMALSLKEIPSIKASMLPHYTRVAVLVSSVLYKSHSRARTFGEFSEAVKDGFYILK